MSSPVLEANTTTLVLGENISPKTRTAAISDVGALLLLTPCVLLIHGYHPFADDAGGIYVAGIEKIMQPGLFGADSVFILAHTHFSIFSHIFAAFLGISHIPLEIGLFLSYLATIFAFLLGSLRISQRIFDGARLQWGATLLAGTLFTLPVAATALWIMDPYVTARSFSTPFSLFALDACIGRQWKRMAFWLLMTALMHPLMAAYLALFLFAYIIVASNCWRLLAISCIAAFVMTAAIYAATIHTPVPDGYRDAVLTRQYFFLSSWRWFEWLGLIMPLLLMLLAATRAKLGSIVSNLCITCIATGVMATVCVLCFVHTNGSYFLDRLQILRSFHLIYAVGVLFLGGFLARYTSSSHVWPGVLLLLFVSGLMIFVQYQSYTTSAHVEWPYAAPKNPWVQAFLWVRHNTPQNAVFAIDAEYTKIPAEDAQGFRTIARRSTLVDDLKDGGVASLFPELAPKWKRERALELNLDHISDQERIDRLKPVGVTWLLLSAQSITSLDCPFHNSAVMVCKLP